MEYKKYSAFISSNLNSLKQERFDLINCLLDAQIIPICMEHFTATTSENFKYIKSLIDQSDIFIMVLGAVYGSCDSDGVSWTEKEYRYAQEAQKICYVLKTEQYNVLLERSKSGKELTQDEECQIRFGEQIIYAQNITTERPISRIMQQIISGVDFRKCLGWTRLSDEDVHQWQENHQYLNLRGRWYHVHLKDDDNEYIRVGTIEITQEFTPEKYKYLHFSASNYNVSSLDTANRSLILDPLKKTRWSGDYFIKDDNIITGAYEATRFFKGKYKEWDEIDKGIYRGVHILSIVDEDMDDDPTDQTVMLSGIFNDVAPSPKMGQCYLFKNKEKRYDFLYERFKATVKE